MYNNTALGVITVAPNEYVVHTRLGNIINQGLGQTFFCLPFVDSYVKFSITPRKINFYADNITKEKQGVGIDGFLIWSIEDGDKAYKKVDSSEEQALDNLSLQLIDLSVSITRSAISNMSLDNVLANRKVLVDELAMQLKEIIVDWGLKIEAIEIKEVKVLSDTLFESMQAPFRNEQLKFAEHSRLETRQSIQTAESETEAAVRIQMAENDLNAKKIEIDNQDKEKLLLHEAKLKDEQRELKEKIQTLENQNREVIKEKELEKDQAVQEKELIQATEEAKRVVLSEQNETSKYEAELQANIHKMEKSYEIEIKDKELDYLKRSREAEISYKSSLNDIKNEMSDQALMKHLYEQLGNSMSNMNFDQIQWYSMGDDNPMSTLPRTIVEIAGMLKGMGILNPGGLPTASND